MKVRPILFSAPMVRAILDGRKTQTRRIVKPGRDPHVGCQMAPCEIAGDINNGNFAIAPYGQPGDRLWVRETWVKLLAVSPQSDNPVPIGPGERLIEAPTSWTDAAGRTRWYYDGLVIAYRANSNIEFCDGDGFSGESANRDDMPRWRPSIHMPRWASRITLEITAVRVERLQDISEADALSEGVQPLPLQSDLQGAWFTGDTAKGISLHGRSPQLAYRKLWNAINGPSSWDKNPYVWVIEFKRA